jgi:hypothetical protein
VLFLQVVANIVTECVLPFAFRSATGTQDADFCLNVEQIMQLVVYTHHQNLMKSMRVMAPSYSHL